MVVPWNLKPTRLPNILHIKAFCHGLQIRFLSTAERRIVGQSSSRSLSCSDFSWNKSNQLTTGVNPSAIINSIFRRIISQRLLEVGFPFRLLLPHEFLNMDQPSPLPPQKSQDWSQREREREFASIPFYCPKFYTCMGLLPEKSQENICNDVI